MPKSCSNYKIKEVIVLEGRNDGTKVKEALNCDIYTVQGFGYGEKTLKDLENYYKTRGLIIFTDPDGPGEKIRKDLNRKFPKAKNAYLSKYKAISKGTIGVENATLDDIREAINKIDTEYIEMTDFYNQSMLIKLGLSGVPHSKEIRDKVCERLNIPKSNSKNFINHLNTLNINVDELKKIVREINGI